MTPPWRGKESGRESTHSSIMVFPAVLCSDWYEGRNMLPLEKVRTQHSLYMCHIILYLHNTMHMDLVGLNNM